MIELRKANERGHANHGWLDSWHSFSFADYYDPAHMNWGSLRVINEDFIAPSGGFGMHGHRDMEIITYVLSGELRHRDSMGNGTLIRPGEVQRMSAGRGVMHSEFNASDSETVHLLQIWISPNVGGVKPSYEQTTFSDEEKRGRLRLIASGDGSEGSVTIHQDARLYASLLSSGESLEFRLEPGRRAYLHVARGSVRLEGDTLHGGDAARISSAQTVRIDGTDGGGEILLFDLAD